MKRRLTGIGLAATLGTLALGAGIARADTGTFSNATSISIPAIGNGFPYPSNIAVTGLNGTVTDVNATLVSFDHPNPPDVEVLLVAPNGQNVVLMGDAGGAVASVNDTFTLDDSSPFALPQSGGIVSGITYRPMDYEMPGLDPFNVPAPSPPYGLTMANLNGANPNGIWSLYTFDDFVTNSGDFSGGWSLTVTSEAPPTPATAQPTAQPQVCTTRTALAAKKRKKHRKPNTCKPKKKKKRH